jgi:hypothetical protein
MPDEETATRQREEGTRPSFVVMTNLNGLLPYILTDRNNWRFQECENRI